MSDTITTDDQPTVFVVPDENLAGLIVKIEALSKKSMKLIGQPITLTIVGEKRVPVLKKGKVWIVDGQPVTELFHEVTVTSVVPRIAGWTFVATIDHSPITGNLIRIVPNTIPAVPEKYRTIGPVCDHCQKIRKRRDTYLLREDATGALKQIGAQCVRDFIGYDPKQVVQLACYLADASPSSSDEGYDVGGGMRDHRYIAVRSYVAHVSAVIRKLGWVSRKDAEIRQCGSTASDAHYNMFPPRNCNRDDLVPRTDYDFELADKALAWAAELEPRGDYEHNLHVLASEQLVEGRSIGLLASIIPAYMRAMEQEITRAERRQSVKGSQHVGKLGERLRDVAVTFQGMNFFDGRFGPTFLYRFVDATGNLLLWYASNNQEIVQGAKFLLTGTVKKHGEYKENAQTVVSRCTLTPVAA